MSPAALRDNKGQNIGRECDLDFRHEINRAIPPLATSEAGLDGVLPAGEYERSGLAGSQSHRRGSQGTRLPLEGAFQAQPQRPAASPACRTLPRGSATRATGNSTHATGSCEANRRGSGDGNQLDTLRVPARVQFGHGQPATVRCEALRPGRLPCVTTNTMIERLRNRL